MAVGWRPVCMQAIEQWLECTGAIWLRLGVIVCNLRAERFWERNDFVEVRRRANVQMKERVHTLRVMVKPTTEQGLTDYFAVVARDRPDSA